MAAAQQQQQPPFLVVSDQLCSIRHEKRPEAWVKVKCGKREAYGCGENGKRILDGLDLYMRPGPEDHPHYYPAIRIGASPEALYLVGCELDEDLAAIVGRKVREFARVHSIDGGVMVLDISFVAGHKASAFKSYCLVYDSTASGALFMLPQRPHGCLPLCLSSPVKLGQDKFAVVLMVAKLASDSSRYPVLCQWSPPANCIKGKHRLDDASENCAWIEKAKLPVPDAIRDFSPTHVFFSYKGNAVWGDLGRGILYCDCGDLNAGRATVDFKSKMLPLRSRAAFHPDDAPLPVYRNMGCVRDSIWVVIIEPPATKPYEEPRPGETMVTVWTLDRLSEEEDWKLHREFKMQTIWDLDGFRAHSLPKTVPAFPMFRQQDDGILYMLLSEPFFREGGHCDHLLGIDLSSSCEEPRLLLPPRRLVIPWMTHPILLDPGFFSLPPRPMMFGVL